MIALPPGLGRKRWAARLVLWFEQAWPALWPALGVAGVGLCAAWAGLFTILPPIPHLLLLTAGAVLFAILLARGLRRLRRPTAQAVDRRLELAGGVLHRPLSVIADRPSVGAAQDPLWQAHLARVSQELGRLRVGWPHPGLAARDLRALRGLLAVTLVASLIVAGPDAGFRLAQAFQPGFVPSPPPPALQIEAWLTLPAFTGQAPVALLPDHTEVTAPAGSRVSVSVSGGSGATPHLGWDHADQPFHPLDASSFQAGVELTHGGPLSVGVDGHEVAHWQVSVLADTAPMVAWAQPPGEQPNRRRNGGVPLTRLPWQVSHQYGVMSLAAELRLRAQPQAPALSVDIPLAGRAPKTAHGARVVDLTANPWAGLPVSGVLVAGAAGGLAGRSATAEFVLPERTFRHPIARAIITVRKMLALRPDDRAAALAALDAIAADTATWQDDAGGFLTLRGAQETLRHDQGAGAVGAVQASLWELALRLEEASASRTAQSLAQARRDLRQALNPANPDKKVNPSEVERGSQAVQRALQKHLQALKQEQRRDPSSHKQPDLDRAQHDAEAALQKLRDAARQNQMDDARDRLAELDQALDQLQQEGSDGATPQQRARVQQQRAGRQQGQRDVTALQDIVRRESGLLDHAQHRAAPADDPANSLSFPPGQAPQEPAPDTAPQDAERRDDHRVQQALRLALGELMQQFGDLTNKVPPKLGEADAAMRDAIAALGERRDEPAAVAAQHAITALSESQSGMRQALAQKFGRPRNQAGDQAGDQGDPGDQGDSQSAEGDAQRGDGSGDQAGGQQGDQSNDQLGDQQDGQDGQGQGQAALGQGRGREDQGSDGGQPGQQRIDPFGRRLQDGGRLYGDGETLLPEKMDRARSRALQDELRRREGDRSRPQRELDYIDRLLNPAP